MGTWLSCCNTFISEYYFPVDSLYYGFINQGYSSTGFIEEHLSDIQ